MLWDKIKDMSVNYCYSDYWKCHRKKEYMIEEISLNLLFSKLNKELFIICCAFEKKQLEFAVYLKENIKQESV